MLEEADADVLLLFDCCHSAAVPTTDCHRRTGGVVEVIAACGYETEAAEVDQHSFTKALTEILAIASKGLPFSIGELHARVLSRLKCWAPHLATDAEGNYIENAAGRLLYERQPRKTPIYSILCETLPRRSIVLGPIQDLLSSSDSRSDQQSLISSPTTSPGESGSDEESNTSSKACPADAVHSGIQFPQVLMAIRLDNQKFDLHAWIEWIRNAPPEARDIRVEGTYNSFSTLVLIRIPTPIWNLLPKNAAYSFVGFITSENTWTWDQKCQSSYVCGDDNRSDFETARETERTKRGGGGPSRHDIPNLASQISAKQASVCNTPQSPAQFTGHLLFTQRQAQFAQRRELENRKLTTNPYTSTEDIVARFVNLGQNNVDRYLCRKLQIYSFLRAADIETLRGPAQQPVLKRIALLDDRNNARVTGLQQAGNCRPFRGPLNARELFAELSQDVSCQIAK